MYRIDELGNLFKMPENTPVNRVPEDLEYVAYLAFLDGGGIPETPAPIAKTFEEGAEFFQKIANILYKDKLDLGFDLLSVGPPFVSGDLLSADPETIDLITSSYATAKDYVDNNIPTNIKVITKEGQRRDVPPEVFLQLANLYGNFINQEYSKYKVIKRLVLQDLTPTTIPLVYLNQEDGPDFLPVVIGKFKVQDGKIVFMPSLSTNDLYANPGFPYTGKLRITSLVPNAYQVYELLGLPLTYILLEGRTVVLNDPISSKAVAVIVVEFGSTEIKVYPLNDGEAELSISVPSTKAISLLPPPPPVQELFIGTAINQAGTGLETLPSDPLNRLFYIEPTVPNGTTGSVDPSQFTGFENIVGYSRIDDTDFTGTTTLDVFPASGPSIRIGTLQVSDSSPVVSFFADEPVDPALAGVLGQQVRLTPILG